MPCPSPGFNATNYHLVVAEEAKLAVGKKYCYQKKSARGGVVYVKISKVCPVRSVFIGFFAHTHPTTLSLQINSKEVHMSELVQYNG